MYDAYTCEGYTCKIYIHVQEAAKAITDFPAFNTTTYSYWLLHENIHAYMYRLYITTC